MDFVEFQMLYKDLYENLNFVNIITENKSVKSKLRKAILESNNDSNKALSILEEENVSSYYDDIANFMGWQTSYEKLFEGEYYVGDGYDAKGYIPNFYDREEQAGDNSSDNFEFPLYWVFTDKNNKTSIVKFKDELEVMNKLKNYPESRIGFNTAEEAQKEFVKRGGKPVK